MDRRRSHFWRGMTMAAMLLFAAAQLVEQSHFHSHAELDPLCVVCAHATGQDGVPTSAPSIEPQPFVAVPVALPTLQSIPNLTSFGQQPRAPPHILS